MGFAYAFTKNVTANIREKDDAWNPATGGFFAGSLIGLRGVSTLARPPSITETDESVRSAPAILGYGAGLAAVLYALSYTGGSLRGAGRDPTVDEVGRKEFLRMNRRRPFEEVVHELGEGRGMSSWRIVHVRMGC